MMSLTVPQISEVLGGRLYGDDTVGRRVVEGLCWDSRQVKPGCAFLAMPGERVDGNDYIQAALLKGAGAVIATRKPSQGMLALAGEFTCPIIVVDDGVEALTKLAAAWRKRLHAVVIGVTGSTGKTSTKEFLRAVLSQRFKTAATQGNHNNEIGVPATILEADEDTEVLIVELGMRGLGQIEALCSFVRPSIGIVTNVGDCHLELLGSRANIARAKSELMSALPPTGLAVLNADNPYTPLIEEYGTVDERGVRVCRFGLDETAQVWASDIVLDDRACASFTLNLPDLPPTPVKLPVPGRHNVLNALAAAATARALGMNAGQIATGLSQAQSCGMRMEVSTAANGITVINDAYNANPDSMRASLDALANMQCHGRRIAVLGDMGELGADEAALHEQVGTAAADAGLDLLVCVGTLAKDISHGAQAAGMDADRIMLFDTVEDAQAFLADTLADKDLMLVKASRFMGMERIVEGVLD